jgi:hypothetical protein
MVDAVSPGFWAWSSVELGQSATQNSFPGSGAFSGTTTGEGRELHMLNPRQLVAFTPTYRDEIRRTFTFIPRNRYCVRAG